MNGIPRIEKKRGVGQRVDFDGPVAKVDDVWVSIDIGIGMS